MVNYIYQLLHSISLVIVSYFFYVFKCLSLPCLVILETNYGNFTLFYFFVKCGTLLVIWTILRKRLSVSGVFYIVFLFQSENTEQTVGDNVGVENKGTTEI